MNRKSKVIVSIVGITIVLLALLGITYAYYLTRIEGNTNTNSISVTTADLRLVYGDGNEIITASNIVPNTTIGEKTFTVTNTGNTTIENYRVVLELASIEGVVPSVFKYPKDFEIRLTCVSKNNTTNEVNGTCSGFNGYWDNETFEMQKNTIGVGIRHEYSLLIKYIDSGIDQSDDMGKNLNLKVQIYGGDDTSTLNGVITGVDSTYAIRLNSKPKVSTLKPTTNDGEYRYSFIGVEPGTHTLSLINKDGSVVSSETLTINKGTESNINGSTITVSDNQSIVHLTTNKDGTTISSTATFNPYDKNTNSLAYYIINNAKLNKNGTKLLNVADTLVAKDIARYKVETTYSDTSWDYGTYDDLYNMCEAPSASTCTKDMIGSYIGENCGDEPTAIITGCDASGKPIVSDYIDEYESSLAVEQDDLGTSYYYRGAVEDNYVTFADMCWRIVRINGDGTTKIILEDQNQPCSEDIDGNWGIPTTTGGDTYTGNFGYTYYDANTLTASDGTQNSGFRYMMNYLHGDSESDKSMATAFKNFQSTFSESELSKLKAGNWCLGDVGYSRTGSTKSDYTYTLLNETQKMDNKIKGATFYYDSYVRLVEENKDGLQPTLKCNGTIMDDWDDNETNPTPMYVGTITADEMVYAGGKPFAYNNNFYLFNENFKNGYFDYVCFRSLSPGNFSRTKGGAFYLYYDGGFGASADVNEDFFAFRPVVSLKSSTTIVAGGEGTKSNPYVTE